MIRHPFARPPSQNRALTILELMVALVLSILVLGMILPLLHQLTQPPQQLNVPEVPVWERSLQADLSELVSPAKCSVPIIQLIPASDTQPYAQLVLQTFCRAGDARGGAASRGPSEVRYSLESEPRLGGLALVRYARGWHDPATSRHVLANEVTRWSVTGDIPIFSDKSESAPSAAKSAESSRGNVITVEIKTRGAARIARLWVPPLAAFSADREIDQTQPANSSVVP